jgi:acyl-CoA synthetase (AMP-forming)/AMP-acid ligase II
MPNLGSRLLSAGLDPASVLVISPGEIVTAGQLVALANAEPAGEVANSSLGLRFNSAARLVRALVLLDGRAPALALLPASLDPAQIEGLAHRCGLTEVIDHLPAFETAPRAETPRETRWILTTSGTTGPPKAVVHNLASLTRTVRVAPADAPVPVWGLLFDPARFSGLQVVFQALLGRGRLVCPDPHAPLGERLAMLATHGCTHLSASSSLWRRILMTPEARQLALSQVTLGGEIADQPLLAGLARMFPAARITHIYASTEAGVGFAVTDGLAGFPARWLDDPGAPVPLRVVNGILWVRPGVPTQGEAIERDAEGYIRTADRVQIQGERVLFVGREGGSVNIGGIKVQPEAVEAVLRGHPSVAECRISARPSAVLGAILAAEVVAGPEAPDDLRLQLKRWCKDRLPREAQPATITLVTEIATTAAGKLARPSVCEATS